MMRLQDSPMPSELSILSAEQYVDTAIMSSNTRSSPHIDDGPRKKRAKTTAKTAGDSHNHVAEKGAKRARGRPRVDPKDQTATERRRTQIRLAQRAYRSRKENAIQTLEKRVEFLRQANEEMSQAFLQLSDFALYNGVLEGAPAFAFELRSTTEKILALARRGSEEDGDEDGQGEPAAASPGQDSSAGGNLQATSALDASVWGYTLKTTDAEMVDPATTTTTNTTIAMPPTTSTSYEELSFDDSPLPFGLTPATPQIDIDLPQQTFTTPNFFQPSLPNTLAHTEATFGRRLQRTALQWGYRLLSHPNPPPHDVTRAFGFCLLFEPADRIRARLRAGLAKLANENLHHWPSPFWALGGSGKQNHHNSYFPPPTTTSSSSSALSSSPPPVGNDGSRDVGKHSFGGDFGMGPFEENVMAAREEKIDPSMRITLPGWSGDFYDPDNVEAYLRSQGMVIRPGQDFATAEVEGGWFEEAEDEDQQQHQQQQKQQVVSSPDTIMSTSSSSSLASGAGGDEWGFETVGFDFGDEASWAALTGSEPVPNESQKKIVTIDVDVLIQELVKRGQCLGRSPGYRLKDINHAFWIASRSDRILEF